MCTLLRTYGLLTTFSSARVAIVSVIVRKVTTSPVTGHRAWKSLALFLLIASFLTRPPPIGAQAPSAAANLSAAITQLRAGDMFGALLSLNDVVTQLTGRPEQYAMLARAHAYRAAAYAGLGQTDRAKEAVTQALKADPQVIVATNDFTPALIALFDEARRPEAAARAADQSGEFGDAFAAFLAAYQALPDPAPAADDRRLREQIIKAVRQLAAAPAIPADAREHLAKADALLEAEAILGSTAGASSQLAETELHKAVRSAPWWPDATFKLASVLQRLQRVDEALLNLTLYKLADPSGYAAAAARVTPATASEKATGPPPGPVPAAAAAANQPAIIYLYYPHNTSSSGSKAKAFCDGQRLGDLENGRFMKLTAAPGTHTIKVGQTVSGVFTGGEEHYVRVAMWPYPAHVTANFALPDVARAEIAEKKIVENDPARTFSAVCSAAGVTPRRNF